MLSSSRTWPVYRHIVSQTSRRPWCVRQASTCLSPTYFPVPRQSGHGAAVLNSIRVSVAASYSAFSVAASILAVSPLSTGQAAERLRE